MEGKRSIKSSSWSSSRSPLYGTKCGTWRRYALNESQLGGIAVANGTYYAEYNYQLYRWKPGDTQWLNTGLLDKGVSDDYSFCYANNWFIDAIGFRFAVSGKTVYVGEKEGQLMQSLDEGRTWTDVTGNLPYPIESLQGDSFHR